MNLEDVDRAVGHQCQLGAQHPTQAKKITLGDLIQRYIAEVLPRMKGASEDSIRLKAICRRPICRNSIASLSPAKTAEYRDVRLKEVAPGTVVRELAYLSSIINHGRRVNTSGSGFSAFSELSSVEGVPQNN